MLVYLIFNIIFTVIFSMHTNHQKFEAKANRIKTIVILTFAQMQKIVTVFGCSCYKQNKLRRKIKSEKKN